MSRLVSIGYGGRRSAAELLDPLEKEHVNVLVDVRYSPHGSLPHFQREALRRSCNEWQIQYVHEQALGNVNYRGNMGPTPILMDEAKGIEALSELLDANETVAIMCACRRQAGCHRELVIAKLLEVKPDVQVVVVA